VSRNCNVVLGFLAAGALIAGCGGGQSTPALSSQNASVTRTQSGRAGSWMDRAATKGSLLYVSSVLTNDVYVYSYPAGQLVGTLTGFSTPYGICADKNANVWIVNDGAQEVVEYAHGGTTPIATLGDPGEYPEGCAVDPATGNLAVTNFYATSGPGSVSVYAGARGAPQIYSDPSFANVRFCGYDADGNLFADGVDGSSSFVLAELRKGASAFKNVAFRQSIEWPGGVQWDGKYIAVGDTDAGKIYRTTAKGNVVGTTTLSGANYVNQFWIVKGKRHKPSSVIAPSQDGGVVGVYKYPAGGGPTSTISVSEPFGAAVSR
jgi:hypothetical protein